MSAPVGGVKPALREVREVVREEPVMRPLLLEALAAGPLTVPELAAAVDRPRQEVLIWIMGMRRYGYVHEAGKANEDGYFPYQAIARDGR